MQKFKQARFCDSHFPALQIVCSFHSEFSSAPCDISLTCDWLLWLSWLWNYDTQSKSALFACYGSWSRGVTLRKFQIHPFLVLSLQLSEGTCFLPTEVEPVNTPDGPITPVPDGIRPVMRKHRIEVLLLYIYTSEVKKLL